MKTAASVAVVDSTAKNTSLVPSAAAAKAPTPALRLRTIFSITTMASSTTRPVARTSANRLMVLTEKPVSQIAASVPTNATGIVTAGIIVARNERRKAKITAITIQVARRIDFMTSEIEFSINTPSSVVMSSSTPSGKSFCSSSTAKRTAFEIDNVLPTDCRVISSPIAVTPLTRDDSSLSSAVSCTNAMSETRVVASTGICSIISIVIFGLPTRSASA